MLTNLIAVAWALSTNTVVEAFHFTDTERVEYVRTYRTLPYSFVIDGIVIEGTNRVMLTEQRRWMIQRADLVPVLTNGTVVLFTVVTNWVEVPGPKPPVAPPIPQGSPPSPKVSRARLENEDIDMLPLSAYKLPGTPANLERARRTTP